jgi:hypothetical protein
MLATFSTSRTGFAEAGELAVLIDNEQLASSDRRMQEKGLS